MVVETMRKDGIICREAARLYDVNSHHQVQNWERIYPTEGPEGLAVERRGRGSKGLFAEAAGEGGRKPSR